MDYEKLKERVKAKVAGEKPAASAEPDGDEGGEMRPGAMLRKALAAKDDDAIEEAIRQCVEKGY